MTAPRLAASLLLLLTSAASAGSLNVKDFGATGDGKTDDTAAFQKALDSAAAAKGGVVDVPVGNYLFAGHLNVPNAVTLKGVWESVPAHNGIRDAGLPKPTDDGTTFLVTEGAGGEEGSAFITLNTNSTLKGVCIYYPNQKTDDAPVSYPYAIAMRGKNPAVHDVELLNPYNGIDASQNERHFIRNVQGQPLRRGIFVDHIYDIGRIENVHFNPWFSRHQKIIDWMHQNSEAFIFGKSDWEYVLNTFCFGYGVGYRFIKTASGECNGNFLGIGADDCFRAVQVDLASHFGVLITNGEFTAFHGPDPVHVEVMQTNSGKIRFVNCAFWGVGTNIARLDGKGTTSFGDCIFFQWDRDKKNVPAVDVRGGSVQIHDSDFRENKRQVKLGETVRKAIVADNLVRGEVRIENLSKGNVEINGNVGD